MSEEIERPLWNVLRPQGDAVPCTVTVRPGGVQIESEDNMAHIDASVHDDGLDVRVYDVQLVVKGKHIALIQQHPPYPIQRWSILWEGDMK